MTVPASVGIGSAAGIVLIVAGLLVALAVTRLDLGVARDDLARARAKVIEIRTAMDRQRANTAGLLARIKHLEGDNEAIAVTTPLPLEFVADQLMTEIEAHLAEQGGGQR